MKAKAKPSLSVIPSKDIRSPEVVLAAYTAITGKEPTPAERAEVEKMLAAKRKA